MRTARASTIRGATSACVAVGIGLILTMPAEGTTYLIDKNGGGDFLNFATAIAASADGDTFLVAAGGYSGNNNKNLDFEGRNLTFISRDGVRAAWLSAGGSYSGMQILRLHSGEDSRTVIDGIMFQGGRSDSVGGAIYLNGASPTFVDCEFRFSEAPSGGAIYCANASPSFVDCKILDSMATDGDGGGIYCVNSSPSFLRCRFFDHYAHGSGGGGCFVSSTPLFEACAVSENEVSEDGGGFAFLDCPAGSVIDLCTFRQNYARRGAGLWLGGNSFVDVTDCTMNTCSAYLQGSNVFCESGSSPSFERTILSFGLHGEAVYCEDGSDPSFHHCLIYGNAAGDSLCANRAENLFEDPLYCDFYAVDYSVCSNSPCLPENNEWGVLIGDRPEGCDSCNTPVESTSWGAIKALFR